MPRSTYFVALQKLEQSKLNFERANKARNKAQSDLYAAMVKAVEAGVTRGEVGRIVGVTGARVAQIPGMPAGANTHKNIDDE
jgi:hypothetical protein